jgi:hypothetical protein
MLPLVSLKDIHGENTIVARGNCGASDTSGQYGDNVKYTIEKIDDENERLILEGTGEMAFFSSDYDTWTTRYGFAPHHAPWYSYRKEITSVEIKDGLEKLGDGALCDLSALKEVTLPASIKALNQCVFMGCSQLKTVQLNEGLTKIDVEVFNNTNIDHLYVPKTVETIDSSNFNALGMDAFTFEEGSPISIKNRIVYAQNGKELIFGEPNLSDGVLNIPYGVEKIDSTAFENNQNITSVTFPDTLLSIGDGAFNLVPLKGEVVIPDYVTELGRQVFSNTHISSIVVGDQVKNMPGLCTYCDSLASVKLGKSVENMQFAFEDCRSLKAITLPDSLTSIGYEAFANSGLSSITIPDGVKKIDDYAFCNCSALTDVTMGKGVTSIGQKAFYQTGMKDIDLYEGLLSIDGQAFDQTQLSYANVPSTVTSVSPDAFPINCVVTRTASERKTHLEENDMMKSKQKDVVPAEDKTVARKEINKTALNNHVTTQNENASKTSNMSIESEEPFVSKRAYLPVVLKIKKVHQSDIKVTYKKVKKAKAYALYMAKGKGSYQLIRKQKKLNYVIKHLKKGNYHFYVEAYNRHNQKIAQSKHLNISTKTHHVKKKK